MTYNDISDADAGANALLNFPILKTAVTTAGDTTITGKVTGLASTTFRVEFFSNPYGTQDSTGYGEARTYLGATTVTTDASGRASFSAVLSGVTLDTGATVTSTATIDLGVTTTEVHPSMRAIFWRTTRTYSSQARMSETASTIARFSGSVSDPKRLSYCRTLMVKQRT
ncbi:MAG: hypothetical protein R3C56_21365 [Pirellulaceae bacterium]